MEVPRKRWTERLWTVRVRMAALSLAMVLVALIVGAAVLLAGFAALVERDLGRRAISIARTVAQMPEIQRAVEMPEGWRVIQPLAERVRLANNVEYVVVLDMQRTRLSHPLPERIGTRFTSGDEGPAFGEQTYFSLARGANGPSVRAFVPIMDPSGTRQVGVVVLGVMTPSVVDIWRDLAGQFSLAAAVALGVGLVMALLLARSIKRQMMGLEPKAIARLLQERSAILDAIGEGLIAIDADERITVANRSARRLLGLEDNVIGRDIKTVVPNTRLPEMLVRGEPEHDQTMLIGKRIVLTNRVPIRDRNRIVGAVATFRDRSELHRLAEQLTGVSRLTDSLRAQNHEFMNRLHTIIGLLELGRYAEAIEYVTRTTSSRQELTQFLGGRFCDARVAALLLGKYSRARELGIAFTVEPSSCLTRLPSNVDGPTLVEILGNLIENAMEAVAGLPQARRQVSIWMGHEGDSALVFEVRDSGPGIPSEARSRIFELGFSTKAGQGRGIGLALVKRHVDDAGGEITVKTGTGGTTFGVRIPMGNERAEDDERVLEGGRGQGVGSAVPGRLQEGAAGHRGRSPLRRGAAKGRVGVTESTAP